MESITSCCSNTPAYGDFSAVSKNVKATQYSKIEASSSQSKDITLYTEEGDKVTLSYNQESSLTYASLSAMSYGFDFSSDENQAIVFLSRRVACVRFSIQDHLSLYTLAACP